MSLAPGCHRLLLACVIVALLAPTSGAARSTTLDARRLALQAQDVPASARRMSQRENRAAALPGGTGHVYTTTFQFAAGKRTQGVGTIVIAAPSEAVARSVFASVVVDAKAGAARTLRLAKLGDEQYAALYGRPDLGEAGGLVWVRTRTVVWQVQTSSIRNPFGFTTTEATRELRKYAMKQRVRVGAG